MTAGSQRIAVIDTVKEAYSLAARSLPAAAKLAGVPVLASLALVGVSAFSGNNLLAVLASTFFVLVLVVSVIAVTLVGQTAAQGVELPPSMSSLYGQSRFWKYVGVSVLCSIISFSVLAVGLLATFLLSGIPFLPAGAEPSEAAIGVSMVGLLASVMVSVYVTFKLFLVTPAMAAGHPFSLSGSWRNTVGNLPRLMAALFVSIVPVGLVQSAVDATAKAAEGTAWMVAGSIFVILFAAIQALLTGAVGGITYRKLADR